MLYSSYSNCNGKIIVKLFFAWNSRGPALGGPGLCPPHCYATVGQTLILIFLRPFQILFYAGLFHRPTSLHAICWPVVDCRRYQSQRDTGLQTRTGGLRCHRVVHGLGWPMGWVGLGRDFSVFGGLCSVGSTTEKVLKIWKDYVNAFKARLDKIWFHQPVKFDFKADLTGTGNR